MQLVGLPQSTADKKKVVVDYAISVVTAVGIALLTRVGQSC